MPDDTFVSPDDEEVAGDEATDEFAAYFSGEATPKVMITTRPRPTHGVFPLISEIMHVVPNSFFYKRGETIKRFYVIPNVAYGFAQANTT